MKKLLVKADPIARRFGFYTAYEIPEKEYVGSAWFPLGVHDVRKYLLNNGYEELKLLEAAKFHPKTGDVHTYSARKVDSEIPRWQYHAHVWNRDGDNIEVFSHYELRPDLRRINGESWNQMYDRLREHYRPDWGETYIRGKACDDVGALVNGHE